MRVVITVYGLPAPQGSKSFKGMAGGHAILVESSKAVKPWREAVKSAALAACTQPQNEHGVGCISGPVNLYVTFTLPRPKSAKRGAKADKRPDLSKLVRSTEDALTDVGAWEDDSRVVCCVSRKMYAGDEGAMRVPGAVIRIDKAL